MFELWLLSCLSPLGTLCFILAMIGLVALIFNIVASVLNKSLDPDYRNDAKSIALNNELKRISKPFMYIGIVCAVLTCLIPTTKEGYMIFGLGSVIDSVQASPVAREFDDKVYKAIDICLDKYIGNEGNTDQANDSITVATNQTVKSDEEGTE